MARKADRDLVCGNHHGQRPKRRANRSNTRLHPTTAERHICPCNAGAIHTGRSQPPRWVDCCPWLSRRRQYDMACDMFRTRLMKTWLALVLGLVCLSTSAVGAVAADQPHAIDHPMATKVCDVIGHPDVFYGMTVEIDARPFDDHRDFRGLYDLQDQCHKFLPFSESNDPSCAQMERLFMEIQYGKRHGRVRANIVGRVLAGRGSASRVQIEPRTGPTWPYVETSRCSDVQLEPDGA
jgi:hypothetical protein